MKKPSGSAPASPAQLFSSTQVLKCVIENYLPEEGVTQLWRQDMAAKLPGVSAVSRRPRIEAAA